MIQSFQLQSFFLLTSDCGLCCRLAERTADHFKPSALGCWNLSLHLRRWWGSVRGSVGLGEGGLVLYRPHRCPGSCDGPRLALLLHFCHNIDLQTDSFFCQLLWLPLSYQHLNCRNE